MKSTHRFISAKRKGRSAPLLAVLGGLLMLFQLLLPAMALAASRSAAATALLNQQGIVDLAGVSVVRLDITYADTTIPATPTTTQLTSCTTLGTIIASWPAQNATDKNTWVLTDGSLLLASPKNTCAPGRKLEAIKILASNEFTNNQAASAQLGQLNCTSTGVCSDVLNAITTSGRQETNFPVVGGATLFSFHSASPLPFVDVEQASTTGSPAPTSIELTNSNGDFPASPKTADPTTIPQFLTPNVNTARPGSAPTTPAAASTQSNEPGMPFIDGNGKITGAQLSNTSILVTMANIMALEKQAPFPQEPILSQNLNNNTLSKQWDLGITQYEQSDYKDAVKTLGAIQNAPPAFQAPAAFVKKAQAHILAGNNGTPTPPSTGTSGQGSQGGSFLGISTGVLLIVGLVAAMLVLVLLFLLVNLFFRRRRIERKRELDNFESDVTRAWQSAERMAMPRQYSQPQSHDAVNYSAVPVSELRCPNCGLPVDEHATFCPNCRYVFASSDTIKSHRDPLPSPVPTQNARPVPNTSPVPVQPIIAAPPSAQQPTQAPTMQDDPAIQATLQRLWDRASR